jgi:ethanolamine-phosphate cytidylyltransferase
LFLFSHQTHYGHLNALRQAKSLGDYLIVGVHSDADISQHKGPTVMRERERYLAVRACKWVDEVVEGAPYVTSLEVINQYGVDFVVHGDDMSVSAETGQDTYAEIKKAGKMRIVPRTTGVSTTDLVGRMLLHTRDHHLERPVFDAQFTSMSEGAQPKCSPYTKCTHFLATSRKIVQFSEGREPKSGDNVVYIDGRERGRERERERRGWGRLGRSFVDSPAWLGSHFRSVISPGQLFYVCA